MKWVPLSFTIRQMPVSITGSTLITAAVLCWLFWPEWHQTLGIPVMGAVGIAGAKVLIYLLSIFGHEMAHAVVGRAFGRTVTYIRLTALGGVTGFGPSGSGSSGAANTRSQWLIAAAGPVANGIFALAWWVVGAAIGPPEDVSQLVLRDIASTAVWLNGALAIFNAIPGLPLDGGQVLVQIVRRSTGRPSTAWLVGAWAGRITSVVVLVLLVLPALIRSGQIDPLRGIWAALIVVILWQGASAVLPYARTLRAVSKLNTDPIWRSIFLIAPSAPVSTVSGATRDPAQQALILVGEPHDSERWLRIDATAAMAVPADLQDEIAVTAIAVPVRVAVVDSSVTTVTGEQLLDLSQGADIIVDRVPSQELRGIEVTAMHQWMQSHLAQSR